MHSLVRRYIRTAIAFLFVGLALGGWMIVRRELYHRDPTPYETSAHVHAIFVGFVMMMILGVALWLFPRPDKSDRHYRPALAKLAYWLLVIGTAARVLGELLRAHIAREWLGWAIVASAMLQVAAFIVYFYAIWGRIRGFGSQSREARGERF